jgi:hypothetical protein
MPFNPSEFRQWCRGWDDDELQRQYQRYVKQTTQGSTGCAVGVGLAFFTFGLSLVGSAISAAELTNAAMKVDILRAEMARRRKAGTTTRKLEVRVRDLGKGLAFGSVGLITSPAGHIAGSAISHAASSGANFYNGQPHIPRVVAR